ADELGHPSVQRSQLWLEVCRIGFDHPRPPNVALRCGPQIKNASFSSSCGTTLGVSGSHSIIRRHEPSSLMIASSAGRGRHASSADTNRKNVRSATAAQKRTPRSVPLAIPDLLKAIFDPTTPPPAGVTPKAFFEWVAGRLNALFPR